MPLWELLGFSITFKVLNFYVKCLEIMYNMIWRYTNKIELNCTQVKITGHRSDSDISKQFIIRAP